MSYNNTVTVLSATGGVVTGRRIRRGGSSGNLRALPDEFHTFTEWISSDGSHFSYTNPLIISSWEDMSLKPVFEEIVVDYQYFADRDAIETWLYIIEEQGIPTGENPYGFNVPQPIYYSGGDYMSGPDFRTLTTNTTVSAFPVRWGFNYLDTYVENGATVTIPTTSRRGRGVLDSNNIPISGSFARSPDTYDQAPLSGFNVKKISGKPVGGDWGSNYSSYNGGVHYYHPYSWGYPSWSVFNSPSVGEASQYPLIHLTSLKGIDIQQSRDTFSAQGMEKFRPIWFRKSSWQTNHEPEGRVVYDMDGMAYWNSLRAFTTQSDTCQLIYHDNMSRSAPFKHTPRLLEWMNYMPNLATMQYNCGNHGPRDVWPLSGNSSWQNDVQDVPHNGSQLHLIKNSGCETYRARENSGLRDYWSTKYYHKNLRQFSVYYSAYTYSFKESPSVPRDLSGWHFTGCKNLRAISIYESTSYESLTSTNFAKNCPDIKSVYLYPCSYNIDVTGMYNLKLDKFSCRTTGTSYAPGFALTSKALYNDEPIRVHLHLTSTSDPSTDQSRFQNKIINHNVTITTT